jgi:hypothetical protein
MKRHADFLYETTAMYLVELFGTEDICGHMTVIGCAMDAIGNMDLAAETDCEEERMSWSR